MKFLIVNTDYPGFLETLYSGKKNLVGAPYADQMRSRHETFFSVADSYAAALRALGHEAEDIAANSEILQERWAAENGLDLGRRHKRRFSWKGIVPWISRNYGRWMLEILETQIAQRRPDVLLIQAMDFVPTRFVRSIRPFVKLIVGQHAVPELPEDDWRAYDLVISSRPPIVDWFRRRNVPAELLKFAFDLRVLEHLSDCERDIPVSFVGSFAQMHNPRTEMLEALAERFPLKIWGLRQQAPFQNPVLEKCYGGNAWGLEMYRILRRSQITLNHHGNVPEFANNMRLYEATGVGTLLLTDWRRNLDEIFAVGSEVVTFTSTEECAERISYYLSNAQQREAIARAGQKRALESHTYEHRMKELETIVVDRLKRR
jgi:hypothetical protein